MSKDSGTRSGLLWEVERLLNEVEHLPQILLMENVPEVAGEKNLKDFQAWQLFLEGKGYQNYTQMLNAKEYGVAQNRNRCFMVSILGGYSYKFPQTILLDKTIYNYLEDEVDESYYINTEKAQKLIQELVDTEQLSEVRQYSDGTIDRPKVKKISNCIKAQYNEGIVNQQSSGGVVVERQKEVKQLGNIMPGTNRENPNQGRVYDKDGLCPSLTTMEGGNRQPMVVTREKSYAMLGSNFNQRNTVHEPDSICRTIISSNHSGNEPKVILPCIDPGRPNKNQNGRRFKEEGEPMFTITAQDRHGVAILTPKRTEYGKAIRKDYEAGKIDESRHNMTELQPREDGITNTITTVQKDNLLIEPTIKIKQATKEGYAECKIGGVADLLYPTSKTRRGRVQENGDICPTITSNESGVHRIESIWRIRKLTPRECWRLFDFTDLDFFSAMLLDREKAKELMDKYKDDLNGIAIMEEAKTMQKMSNSQLYRQCGNSICLNVLVAIFKRLLPKE